MEWDVILQYLLEMWGVILHYLVGWGVILHYLLEMWGVILHNLLEMWGIILHPRGGMGGCNIFGSSRITTIWEGGVVSCNSMLSVKILTGDVN